MAQSDWRIVGFSEAYESHYPRDIQSSIAGSLAAGATHDEIIRGVGRVAARYGIGDWEARPESFVAIGRAYKLAGKSERKLAALADKLAGGEDEKRKLMLSSYREQAISTRTQ